MFGTLYLPTARETLTFGLANDEDAQFQTLRALYTRPFRNLLSRE
jgi:hypothetical protein